MAHGSDPTKKNQEGQTPLDIAAAEDVRCLLSDAMPSPSPSTSTPPTPPTPPQPPSSPPLPHGDGAADPPTEKIQQKDNAEDPKSMTMASFLAR